MSISNVAVGDLCRFQGEQLWREVATVSSDNGTLVVNGVDIHPMDCLDIVKSVTDRQSCRSTIEKEV